MKETRQELIERIVQDKLGSQYKTAGRLRKWLLRKLISYQLKSRFDR